MIKYQEMLELRVYIYIYIYIKLLRDLFVLSGEGMDEKELKELLWLFKNENSRIL